MLFVKMLKNYVLCFALCFCLQALLCQAALDESELDATDLHCLKELSIDKSVVLNSYDENNYITEGNTQMNTFFTCAWKKDGLQNEDDSINSAGLEKIIEVKLTKMFPDHANYRKHLAVESVKACAAVKGSDNGDTCVKVYNCVLKSVGEITRSTNPEDFP